MKGHFISSCAFLKGTAALGTLTALENILPRSRVTGAAAPTNQLNGNMVDLTVAETLFRADDRSTTAITINGTVPVPLLRLCEGPRYLLYETIQIFPPKGFSKTLLYLWNYV